MKHKIFIVCVSLVALYPWRVMAQADITVSGANGTGSGGTVSYSVGQVAYKQYTATGGSANEGVQQTYEVELGLENKIGAFDCTIYPNPTLSGVQLVLHDSSFPDMHANLLDATGKTVLALSVLNEVQHIQMEHLPAGTYILRLYSVRELVKSFKIIKY